MMRISDGLEMLELEMKLGGRSMMINPVIINDKDDWTLIDTGMPGLAADILSYVEKAGISKKPLRAIILTHQDIDHIGGFPGFLDDSGEAPFDVYAHADDRDTIDGKAGLLKFPSENLAAELASVPDDVRKQYEDTYIRPPSLTSNNY